MKLIKKSETESFTNSPTCAGYIFPFGDNELDIAVVTVNGRYPEQGYALNEVSKEIAYVLKGTGKLVVDTMAAQDMQAGDAAMILPGEKYYWEGDNLELIIPCSPAFTPTQHKLVAS